MIPCSYPTLAALTIAFWTAAPASALDLPDCDPAPGSAESCAPVLACMPGEGVWFVGRAVGWDRGTLSGVTNTGVKCTGEWAVGETSPLAGCGLPAMTGCRGG